MVDIKIIGMIGEVVQVITLPPLPLSPDSLRRKEVIEIMEKIRKQADFDSTMPFLLEQQEEVMYPEFHEYIDDKMRLDAPDAILAPWAALRTKQGRIYIYINPNAEEWQSYPNSWPITIQARET